MFLFLLDFLKRHLLVAKAGKWSGSGNVVPRLQ
jgi:hypothetical protein